MTTKMAKYRREAPRSFSTNRTTSDIPHATRTGPRCLAGGSRKGPRLVVARDRRSRLAERYEARNTTTSTLAISDGWKLIGPISTHSLAPLIVPGVGRTINGARLWVEIGPISFQPSEIAKVLVVVFLASYLSAKRELLSLATTSLGPFRLPPAKHLGPVLVAWGMSLVVLFVEKDLGASLLYFAIFVVMLWVATGRSAYLVIGGILFAVGAAVGYREFAHVQTRVDIWLHALDPNKVFEFGYGQLAQAEFGLATGGLVGAGLGRGSPTLIPYASTDFIFAAIGEELGLFGTAAVLLLYVVLVGKGLKAALQCPDGFGKLLATGLSASIGLQAFVIVAGVTRVIPLTGVTLPFVSYGGSSLV